MAGIGGRCVTIVVVTAGAHNVPVSNRIVVIICVVEIRQTKHMPELMAECTDGGTYFAGSPIFGCAGVGS